jgi:cell wall-associated NlpC family hydrolase
MTRPSRSFTGSSQAFAILRTALAAPPLSANDESEETVSRLPLLFATPAIICLLALSSSASADPTVSSRRTEAKLILAELDQMDAQLSKVVEASDKANWKLAETKRELASTRVELGLARENLQRSRRVLSRLVISLYTEGESSSTLAVLLGASSLQDALDRLDAVQRISDHDAQIVEQVKGYGEQVAKRETVLKRAEVDQQHLVNQVRSEKSSIESKIAARRVYYQQVKREIATAIQAERRRTQELAAAATRRVEQQTGATISPREFVPPPPNSPTGSRVVAIAMQYLGVPYRWGGADPSTGFDCSGFVMYVYAKVGISLPHYTGAQWSLGVPVARSDLQPGDVVFFNGVSHDGIYIGNGQFIQAPRTGDVVKVSSLSESWYASTYDGARRYGT